MRLIGYIRVSRVGGRKGDSFISPSDQREAIQGYASSHGHQVVDWYEDLDESGGKASRPQFDRALERVGGGGADGLIVWKLDRFMRSLADALNVIEQLEAAGGELISVVENIDATTSTGRLMRNQFLSFAEYEREQRKEGFARARRNAVGRGVHVASQTPTGYRKREDKRLEPDPVAAPVVAELFRCRAAGEGWSALARYVNESGAIGPYGNERWTHGAVQKLIHNRVYLGEAFSGEYVKTGAHKALVAEKVWLAANRKKAPANPGNKKRETQLLTGLVRCEGCRYVMKADTMRARDGSRLGSTAAGSTTPPGTARSAPTCWPASWNPK
jgi:site-specific DNA recombinase